jgi:hypothetical protein
LPNQFILFEFIVPRKLRSYTLRSYQFEAGGCHLKNWELLARSTDDQIIVLDQRSDCEDLNRPGGEQTFEVRFSDNVKIAKLQITDVNHAGSHTLVLNSIAFVFADE